MVFGNRGARSAARKQRKNEAFHPRGEKLEDKILLTLLQLGSGTPFNLSGQTTTAPNGPQTIGGQLPFIADSSGFNPQTQGTQTTDPGLGVMETSSTANQGAGYSVAALGDMNLDGSDDYILGAPTASYTTSSTSNPTGIAVGTGTSTAYLVFANRSFNLPSTQSWLSSTPEERVGLLSQLGTSTQTNPFTNRTEPYSYAFDGVSFQTLSDPSSGLGAFVAAAGPNAFVIGAPNYTGGGRLYYIQATSNFNAASLRGTPINLDQPNNSLYAGLTIVTFEDTANPNSGLGSSFADVPNLFGDGTDDLVIGESGASVAGGTATGTGGVFVFPTSSLPLNIGANNVVQVSTAAPFRIAGVNSGDLTGFSVANAGDVNGQTLNGNNVNDLLIGAPGFNKNAGAAYLVYGGTPLTNGATGGLVNLSQMSVRPTTTTGLAPAQGAVFVGTGTDLAGWTVSGAGDFNPGTSALDDFMIGSPGGNGGAGRVNLFYGASSGTYTASGTSAGYSGGILSNTVNPITLNNPTVTLPLTGFTPVSASFVGAGSAFHAGYSMSYYNNSTGASVIIIGVPNDTTNSGSGSVYELLGPSTGTFATQLTPLSNSIARQYTLRYPTTFTSSNAIGFGISVSAYPDEGGDFIAGAPGYTGTLSAPATTTPLAGAVTMVLNSLQPSGTLTALGSSGGGGGGGGGIGGGASAGAILPGTFQPTTYVSPLGTTFVPTVSALSAFNYAPIPLKVALQQYLPPEGFLQRQYAFAHPGKKLPGSSENRGQTHATSATGSRGVWTLGSKVFDRGRFHPGKTYQWTHTSPHNGTVQRVVPSQLSRQRYSSAGNSLGKA